MSRSLRVVGPGVLLLTGLVGGELRAQPEPPSGLGLVYSAEAPGEGCPDEAWFRQRIEALARWSVFAPPEREQGAIWVLLRRIGRTLRLDVMLRTDAGVKGLRSFESEEQTCSQLLEAAALSLSIAAMDALGASIPGAASASASIAAPPPGTVVPVASSAPPLAPERPPPPSPRYEVSLGPAVVNGWSPSFTGAAVLGAGVRSGWSTLGGELRLLPPKRRGALEVQSASMVFTPCVRLDALGFCGVVMAGVWSGGPGGEGDSQGVLGAGGQLRIDGNLSERVGLRAFAEVLAPLRRPTFSAPDASWRLPPATVAIGTLMTLHFL